MDLKKEIMDDIEKAQLSAEEILRKYDKESDKRELTGIWNTIINAICIVFCIFQVYTAAFGILDAQLQRAIHLAFGFALVFLLYPMRQSWSRKEMNWIDVGFAVVGVAVSMYIVVFYHDLVLRAGMNNETDYIIALIGTLLVIEGARRVVGWPMITIAILFVLYGLFGRMLPGIIAHRGLGLHELVNYLYYTTEGIFGTPMGVSSTFIYLFILFGAYLETTGLGKFFIDISNAIADYVEPFGYGIVEELVGHGIGHALHEDPQIPNFRQKRKGIRLMPGMTLAIEPMINIGRPDVEWLDDDWTVVTEDGSLSAHYENTILINEEGEPDILTLGHV